MSAVRPAGERIVRNLQDAVERLHEDIARVELWAGALGCFAQPVPDYDPSESNLNKFALPGETGRRQPDNPLQGDGSGKTDGKNPAPKRASKQGDFSA